MAELFAGMVANRKRLGYRSATAPALLSTAVPDAVLPPPSMGSYLLHPCSRPALCRTWMCQCRERRMRWSDLSTACSRRGSRRPFPTPFYLLPPWSRTASIPAVVLRFLHLRHPWRLRTDCAGMDAGRKLLGNCSCVALPPASLQSSCVFCTCAIPGVRSERRSQPRMGKRQEGAHHRTALHRGSILMAETAHIASRQFRSHSQEWWPRTESNRRHGDFQSPALPTELLGPCACVPGR